MNNGPKINCCLLLRFIFVLRFKLYERHQSHRHANAQKPIKMKRRKNAAHNGVDCRLTHTLSGRFESAETHKY